MKQLGTIKPRDVDASELDINEADYTPRSAGRAVVRRAGAIALLYVGKHEYYMLPGGGLDDGEDVAEGLARELLEELGIVVETRKEVGQITIYNKRWLAKQTDYCFVVDVVAEDEKSGPTEFEVEEGHKIVWANNLDHAIQLVSNTKPELIDGKLIRLRDLRFLEEAQRILS